MESGLTKYSGGGLPYKTTKMMTSNVQIGCRSQNEVNLSKYEMK